MFRGFYNGKRAAIKQLYCRMRADNVCIEPNTDSAEGESDNHIGAEQK